MNIFVSSFVRAVWRRCFVLIFTIQQETGLSDDFVENNFVVNKIFVIHLKRLNRDLIGYVANRIIIEIVGRLGAPVLPSYCWTVGGRLSGTS